MAEAVAAAATLVSLIGFGAQVFDGCVKGFVLLSTANNLGRDADILQSMLDWEQYRLEQWSEQVGLHDPAKADMLADWQLITDTLRHLEHLLTDTSLMEKKYNLILKEDAPISEKKMLEVEEGAAGNRFKRLFGQSDRYRSTAAAKVIQSKSTNIKRLRWAAVDKANMKRLLDDISTFVQRLYDALNISVQGQIQESLQLLVQQATSHYSSIPDLDYLREVAMQLKRQEIGPPAESLDDEIRQKYYHLFFAAIRQGNTREVGDLLERGIDVNATNIHGYSACLYAAQNQQDDVLRFLHRNGGDLLAIGPAKQTALHHACSTGHMATINFLLEQYGVNVNCRDSSLHTPLFMAVDNNHKDAVERLLATSDIDVNAATNGGFTPLHQALFSVHEDIIQLLLARPDVDVNKADASYHQSPLWLACNTDDKLGPLKGLLARNNIDVNSRGQRDETCVARCAKQSYNKALELLLSQGADVRLPDEAGNSPLILAAKHDNEEGLKILSEHADIQIDVVNKSQETALWLACKMGNTKCARVLLTKRPQLETQNAQGWTALSIASYGGHKIPAKMLIRAGANIDHQDCKGNTPLALAAAQNKDILVRLLLGNGAKTSLADEDDETPFEKARDQRLEPVLRIFKEVLRMG